MRVLGSDDGALHVGEEASSQQSECAEMMCKVDERGDAPRKNRAEIIQASPRCER
jgi:hypothetical protein